MWWTAQCAGIIRVRNGMNCAWTFLWWNCALWLCCCCILLERVETCLLNAMPSHSIFVPRHSLCSSAGDFPYVEKVWVCAWSYGMSHECGTKQEADELVKLLNNLSRIWPLLDTSPSPFSKPGWALTGQSWSGPCPTGFSKSLRM